MNTTVEQYAQALFDALSGAGDADQDLILDNLVLVLKANNDLDKFEKVITSFEKLSAKAGETSAGELSMAHKIELNKNLLDELNTIAKKKMTLQKSVDETLVGGMVLRVDDVLLDTSVKKELDDLKEHLTN